MTARTHMISTLSLGLIAPIILNNAMQIDQTMFYVYIVALLVGSVFPDIDEPNSYIGRKLYIVSLLLSQFVEHRGITHTLLIVLLYGVVAIIVFTFGEIQDPLLVAGVIGFLLGNIGHMLGDMLTKSGVVLFYPFSITHFGLLPKKFRFYTGGMIEHFVVQPIFILIVVAEVNYLGVIPIASLSKFISKITYF